MSSPPSSFLQGLQGPLPEYIAYNARTFEDRQREANRIIKKYHDRIPVVIEQSSLSRSRLPELDRHKYMFPKDDTIAMVQNTIRKRLNLSQAHAIFLLCDGALLSNQDLISVVYNEQKVKHGDQFDGFLFITYRSEETFGTLDRVT